MEFWKLNISVIKISMNLFLVYPPFNFNIYFFLQIYNTQLILYALHESFKSFSEKF